MPINTEQSVLVLANFTNSDKIERHVKPLADVTSSVKMVTINPKEDLQGIDYIRVPTFGHRIIGVILTFLYASYSCSREDYDSIVSVCLFPYGLYGLLLGGLFNAPTHLAIMGIDLDYHATRWYGRFPQLIFRLFDSISVPGDTHKDKLISYGIPETKITLLANAIDTTIYKPPNPGRNSKYDFIWAGRLSPEKDPLLFVDALVNIDARGKSFNAVILGTGELENAIRERVLAQHLEKSVDIPGWVDDPITYYHDSDIFALTSEREGLSISLLEAMASGLACVTPSIGNIPDVVNHEHNAILIEDLNENTLADQLQRLMENDELRETISENATEIRDDYSYQCAREDWDRILTILNSPQGYHDHGTTPIPRNN